MKRKSVRKLVIAAQLVSLLFGFAACGGESEGGSVSVVTVQSTPSLSGEQSKTGEEGTVGANTIFAGEDSEEEGVGNRITIALPANNTNNLHTAPNQWYDRLIEEISAYTGIEFTLKWYTSGSYEEQIKKDIASGEVADVIYFQERSELYEECAESGLLWEIGPYIDDYDNHAMTYEVSRLNASCKGRLYGLPRCSEPLWYGMGYRVDWLDRLGLEPPKDWESFEKMLYAFTYNDPDGNGEDDTVGLVVYPNDRMWDVMETWFGVPNVWGIDANGDLIHKTRTQEYRNAYAAFRKLYAQGVINNGSHGIPDFRESRSWGTVDLDLAKAGSLIDWLGGFHTLNSRLKEQGAAEDVVFDLSACVDTGLGELCYSYNGVSRILAVTTERVKDEEQLRTVLQFLNDLNDAACDDLIHYGWEGITYRVDEKDKNMVLNRMSYDEEQVRSGLTTYKSGFGIIKTGFVAEENKSSLYSELDAEPLSALYLQLQKDYRDKCVINYGYPFSSETEKERGEELEAELFEAEVKYIVGEIDEAGFEEALTAWWENGGEAITREMNEEYHAAGYFNVSIDHTEDHDYNSAGVCKDCGHHK